ncbi:hypothetical protein F5Y08DRAFT_313843 [Xylaria arbuscula]|nr:hypothetical protein F5Y08DRAFT_313843 [Xylaria arbuscula]
MARTKYHKFRGGERCDECGARQWFAQDSLRYCRNGHRLEGFADHEGDEDDFDTQGRVTRKKKEARRKVAVKLAGDEGRELYLEVLQLILIRQIKWLVDTRGFPDDFAELVRALWSLRVRNLPLRRSGGDGTSRGYESETGASSAWFSSQGEVDDSSGVDFSDATTTLSGRKRWHLPQLIDTLALCYLGCLVKRLPVSTADIHHWVQKGDLEFLCPLNQMPRNVRDRLPPEYHKALQVRDHLPAGRLQNAVQQLITSYKVKFDITIPPLNYVPILLRLITDLVLPIDIYTTVKCIGEILETWYSYPTKGGKRIRTMDNPEVFLVCSVVVSAKLLYSLDGVERLPISPEDPRRTKVDWQKWRRIIEEKPIEDHNYLKPGEEYKVTAEETATLEETKLDDYMDWFERMWLHGGEPPTTERIRDLFEQKRTSSRLDQARDVKVHDDPNREKYQRFSQIIEAVDPISDSSEDEKKKPRNLCPVWRKEADLPSNAKILYGRAAELAAIPLVTLIRGAVQLERQIDLWCIQEAKNKKKGKDEDSEQEWKGFSS